MTITDDDLEKLRALDTPTICNALEVVAPDRRGLGFNRIPLVCPAKHKGPVVGFARTARITSSQPSTRDDAAKRALRMAYYEYIDRGPRPSLAVIQDIDEEPALGAFWGEVQTNIHINLGCLGMISDGSVRDLDEIPAGFFVLAGAVMPSHVWVELADFDTEVTVAGMHVNPGDLIHADKHGAAVVPAAVARDIPAAAEMLVRREKVILDATAQEGFDAAALARAIADSSEIH